MTPAEEDALIREHQLRSGGDPVEQRIRLAIRAAYAKGREDAARVCEDMQNGWASDDHLACAAAIRRGRGND